MYGILGAAGRVRQLSVMLGIVFCSVAIHGNGAQAGDCVPSRASASPEIARLQRQIVANRAFEVKYSCAAQSTFACREIAGRIAQTSARLASLSAASSQSCKKPMIAERAPARRTAAAPVRSTTAGYALPHISARMETRCVRLSDGYSFPTPNSGYSRVEDVEAIAAQCKFICDDPAMDVYRMTGADRNTDEMVSVTTGTRYAELPNAGAYRTAAPLQTCDMNRFYKTVLAKIPATDPADPDLVLSNSQTVQPAEAGALNVALLGDVGLRGTASFVPAPARKVRIVGAAYLPAN